MAVPTFTLTGDMSTLTLAERAAGYGSIIVRGQAGPAVSLPTEAKVLVQPDPVPVASDGTFTVTLAAVPGLTYSVSSSPQTLFKARTFDALGAGEIVDLSELIVMTATSPSATYVRGQSAYEVAVADGFVGTEAEWLASLEGPTGPTGPTGPPAVGYDSTGAPYILTATAPDATTQPANKRLVTEARLAAVTPGDIGAATAAQGAKADTALQLTSTRPTVLLVGDSITAQCGRPGLIDVLDGYNARGFFNWANWLMGERFNVVKVAGIGGQTSADIASRIASDMAANPSEWVVLECGTNDVSQDRSYADIVASFTACLDAIQAAGRKCCLVTVWPSNSYTTTSRRQIAAQVSQWIVGLPLTRPGVVVADVYSALVDPATGMLGAGMTFDVVHPGSAAAYRAGVKVADAMRPFAPPLPNLRRADTDPASAIGNASFLTSGSGWTLDIGTGATYTRNPDGFGNMATATVAAGGVQFAYMELLGPRINIGDVVQVRARHRWSGLTWSAATTKYAPYNNVTFRASSGAYSSGTTGGAGTEPSPNNTTFGVDDVSTSGDVIVTSPKLTIPATATDATAITKIYAQFGFRSTNLTGGTVTISDVSVYKV